jgi:hypothetical protein
MIPERIVFIVLRYILQVPVAGTYCSLLAIVILVGHRVPEGIFPGDRAGLGPVPGIRSGMGRPGRNQKTLPAENQYDEEPFCHDVPG